MTIMQQIYGFQPTSASFVGFAARAGFGFVKNIA